MFVTDPYDRLRPIFPPSNLQTPAPSKEQEVFNKTLLADKTEQQAKSNPFTQNAAEILPSAASFMLEKSKKTTEKKRKYESLGTEEKNTCETVLKTRRLEINQDVKGNSKKEKADSTSEEITTPYLEEHPLTIENIPSLIESKSLSEIVEIIKKANALLPKNWIHAIQDLPTKALLYIALYETGHMGLGQLYKHLNPILEKSKYSLFLENNHISLSMLYHRGQQNYDMLKALSKITALNSVFLEAPFMDKQIENIVFPYVTNVRIGGVFSVECFYPLNFAKLFPNSISYIFEMSIAKAKNLLNTVPLHIICLIFFQFKDTQGELEAKKSIVERFKNLQTCNFLNFSKHTVLNVQFDEPEEM